MSKGSVLVSSPEQVQGFSPAGGDKSQCDIITTICLDCKQLSRMLCFHIPWHGWDNTCLRCGRNWQDGEWMPLEFSRSARRDNIESAKKKWKEKLMIHQENC